MNYYEDWIKYFKTLEPERRESIKASLENLLLDPEIKKSWGGDFSGLINCIQSAQRKEELNGPSRSY